MSIIFLQNIDRVKWIQETIKNLSPRRKKKKKKKGSRQTHGLYKHISSSVRAKYDYPGRAASNFVGGHHETPLPVQETPGTEVNCHLALTDVPFCPISNLTSLSLTGQMEIVETNVKGEKKKSKASITTPTSWAQAMEKFYRSYCHISSECSTFSARQGKWLLS